MRSVFTAAIALLMMGVAISAPASAEPDWPNQPIKLVVPLSAGGGVDTMARIVAEGLTEKLGERVIVENQAGAGGTIASGNVAAADPDGYTFVFQSISSAVVNPLAYDDLPYDPVGGFAPVTMVTQFPLVFVTHPDIPAKNFGEFISLLKNNPGKYNYGSSGVGTVTHLAAELFNSMAGTEMVHVPYKGNAPATTDLLAGRLALVIDGVAPQIGNIKSGAVVPLAVTTAERSEAIPDVPAVKETFPDYVVPYWTAMFAPAGTPEEIRAKMAEATHAVVTGSKTAQRLKDLGAQGVGSSPGELDRFWHQQLDYFEKIIKEAGI